ncbi:MAG: C40 family peptidase [Bacteroidota bacterium]
MIKNVSKWIMLLGIFAFLLPSCTSTRRTPNRSSTAAKGAKNSEEVQLRKDLVRYAYRYEGAKYQYGGNGPRFDCSGLTTKIYDNFNIQLPRTSSAQAAVGKKIPTPQARPGDLAFFSKGKSGGRINHVALVVDNDRQGLVVIHSTTSRGVVIDNIHQSSYWKPRLLYVRQVIGN